MNTVLEVPKAYQCKRCLKIHTQQEMAEECFDSHVEPKLKSLYITYNNGCTYPTVIEVKMVDGRTVAYYCEE